jgi:hypothetical protein
MTVVEFEGALIWISERTSVVPELTFYHQVRADGGERTGIDLDGQSLLQHYQEESSDFDPSLLWYVDIVCQAATLPDDPERARNWFLEHEAFFGDAIRNVAREELGAGFDTEVRPFRREMENGPDDARVRIVVAAVRRLVARQVADRLREVADHWKQLVSRLDPMSVV